MSIRKPGRERDTNQPITTLKIFLGSAFDLNILDILHHWIRHITIQVLMEPEIGFESWCTYLRPMLRSSSEGS